MEFEIQNHHHHHHHHKKMKRFNLEDDPSSSSSTSTTTRMEILPKEIAHDILSRLPITSLVQFKSVCRAWRAMVAQDPFLANFHLCNYTSKTDPCLILHIDFPIKNHIYFVDLSASKKDKIKVKRIHLPFFTKLPEFDVVASCNGLLCLSDSLYNDSLYIYNPFTSNYLELPKSLQYPDQEVVFGFGFHPKTKEYKVIRVVYYRNGNKYSHSRRIIYPQSELQILTVGSSSWRSLGRVSYQLVRRSSEALVNGRLHWVTRPCRYKPSRRLVSFDLSDEQFREISKPDCGGLNRCNYHLVVLKGCLTAAVYCNYGRLEIWVMKEYNVKESWVKEFSIGSYAPKGLKQNPDRPIKIWRNASNGRVVRAICLLKNGEILLEYKSRVLVTYDPKEGKFKDFVLQGTPKWFQTVAHVGSLTWLDTSIDDSSYYTS